MSDLQIHVLSGPVLRTKLAPNDAGEFSGWLVRYNERDSDDEEFARGSFGESLRDIKAAGRFVPMLWQHRQEELIGSWRSIEESSEGLHGEGSINLAVPRGKQAWSLVQRQDLTGISVGFTSPAEWRQGRTIRKAKLYEASLVSIPSVDKARVSDFRSIPAFAEALAAGQPLARRDAEWIARKCFTAGSPDGPDPDELARLAKTIEAQTRALKGL